MKKLISRNPVLRFKLGRKIGKFLNPGSTLPVLYKLLPAVVLKQLPAVALKVGGSRALSFLGKWLGPAAVAGYGVYATEKKRQERNSNTQRNLNRWYLAGRANDRNPIWVDRTTGKLYKGLTPAAMNELELADYMKKNLIGDSYSGYNITKMFSDEGPSFTINGRDYMYKQGTNTPYDLSPEAQKVIADRNAKLAVLNNKENSNGNNNGNKNSNVKSSTSTYNAPTFRGVTIGGKVKDFSNAITEDLRNQLINSGAFTNDDFNDTMSFQNALNRYFGKDGYGSVKEDGMWGNQTQNAFELALQKAKAPVVNTTLGIIVQEEPSLAPLSKPNLDVTNINIPKQTVRSGNFDRSQIRDMIRQGGFNPYNYTGELRKALRLYLNGQSDDTSLLDGTDLARFTLPFRKKGGILPSRNIVERFKNGRKIDIFKDGGVKRYSVSHTDKKKTVYFDTEEQAKAYLKKQKAGTTVRRDSKKEASGQVLKVDRTKEKATQYGRQQLEKNNNLSFKQAYQAARKSGNKYFAYKGKVYKSDLENGKDNMAEMALHYGNNLGYSGDPKLGTKKSMAARAKYRKDIDTSEVGYTGEKKKFEAPYVSSYDGGELFSNFMGLASPTRWAGAVGRASRGEGNTGTFVGKVLNNMLDPQNGARENQGIFSSGLAPTDEQWAAEHPVISGIVNGALDAAVYGPKPRFNRDFKFKTNWGYNGRQFQTVKEEVPMGIFEGDLNISPGVSAGSNPYIQLGNQVGETTKTVTRRVMTNPGTKYVKSVTEKPTGKYNFSWSEGMKDMFPWVTANTFNRTMQL